jgi:site-specific recombinase XerD
MRAFFHFCAARDWIPKNPATDLKAPKSDLPPTMPFSDPELQQILDAVDLIDNPNKREIERARLRARALVLTLLYSGFRISDAVKLARGKVNMQTGQLLFRMMKTGASLYIRLPQVALDALAALPVQSLYFSGAENLNCPVPSDPRAALSIAS